MQEVKAKPTVFDMRENDCLKRLKEWNVANWNDSAKWRMYFYYCGDTCVSGTKNKTLSKVPLGFLRLKLGYTSLENDTLTLLYSFVYDDSTEVRYTTYGYSEAFGVSFDVKNNVVIGYATGNGTFLQKGPNVKYENPYHPEIVKFIKENSNKIDPWFKQEAERRKFL
jgi:hypothetical protein